MENHEPLCKKIKLIECEEDVYIEKDVVLGEEEDEDPVIIIDDWKKEEEGEEEEDIAYMGVDQPVHLNVTNECIAFMMVLPHLYNKVELLHILAKVKEEKEKEAEE